MSEDRAVTPLILLFRPFASPATAPGLRFLVCGSPSARRAEFRRTWQHTPLSPAAKGKECPRRASRHHVSRARRTDIGVAADKRRPPVDARFAHLEMSANIVLPRLLARIAAAYHAPFGMV